MPINKSRQVVFFTREEMDAINNFAEKNKIQAKEARKQLILKGYAESEK